MFSLFFPSSLSLDRAISVRRIVGAERPGLGPPHDATPVGSRCGTQITGYLKKDEYELLKEAVHLEVGSRWFFHHTGGH